MTFLETEYHLLTLEREDLRKQCVFIGWGLRLLAVVTECFHPPLVARMIQNPGGGIRVATSLSILKSSRPGIRVQPLLQACELVFWGRLQRQKQVR